MTQAGQAALRSVLGGALTKNVLGQLQDRLLGWKGYRVAGSCLPPFCSLAWPSPGHSWNLYVVRCSLGTRSFL